MDAALCKGLASVMRAFRILSLGYEPALLVIRTLLLSRAGYEVVEANSCKEALVHIKSRPLDLLLICHSVPFNEQNDIVAAVRVIRSRLPILCLTADPFQSYPVDCAPASSTAPEFLEEVSKVLRRGRVAYKKRGERGLEHR